MQRDLVIGCISGYDFETIQYWVNSLDSCGFSGHKAVIVRNVDLALIEVLRTRGYEVIADEPEVQTVNDDLTDPFQDEDISVERFRLIWRYLSAPQRETFRYVISVDVRDAIFQRNPSDWLETHLGSYELNVSSEALTFHDEAWNNASLLDNFGQALHRQLSDAVIWNAGVIAGSAKCFTDLCLVMDLVCRSCRTQYADQAALNVILSTEAFGRMTRFSRSEDGWASHGTLADPALATSFRGKFLEPAPTFDGQHVVTHAGQVYSVVHQYDRIAHWREALQRKYGELA